MGTARGSLAVSGGVSAFGWLSCGLSTGSIMSLPRRKGNGTMLRWSARLLPAPLAAPLLVMAPRAARILYGYPRVAREGPAEKHPVTAVCNFCASCASVIGIPSLASLWCCIMPKQWCVVVMVHAGLIARESPCAKRDTVWHVATDTCSPSHRRTPRGASPEIICRRGRYGKELGLWYRSKDMEDMDAGVHSPNPTW